MNWSRSSILMAGIGVILLTNAVALGGVAYNRSGEPDSMLRLTERELQRPYDWGRNRENSGLALTLRWRTLAQDAEPAAGLGTSYIGAGGSPKWLDEAKLIALGFDAQPRRHSDGRMNAERVLPREVLLVFELNGPTYQRALDGAREHAAHEEGLKIANPNNTEMAQRAQTAKEQLDWEENASSKLFVVDAGLDAAQLRLVYPDRFRYAIVHGEVRPQWSQTGNAAPKLAGYVSGVHNDSINVPLAFHATFASSGESKREGHPAGMAPGEIVVAFGRRLEPWIVDQGPNKNGLLQK
jgi:hypothetical protein